MKKIIIRKDGLRLDGPDVEAIHDLTVGEFRRTISALLSGDQTFVVEGFTAALSGGGAPKQITVTRGVAVCGENDAGTVKLGQLLSEGQTSAVWDFSGAAAGTYDVWVRMRYDDGETANRAYLHDNSGVGEERVAVVATRAVPDWDMTAALEGAGSPGAEYVRVCSVTYSGADLVASDVVDSRSLLFEGEGDTDGWTMPDFDRGDDRGGADGITSLRGWVWAVNRRLQELGGRDWQKAPAFGENVRSASSAITVSGETADAGSVHQLLDAPTTASLTTLLLAPGGTGTDRRERVEFVRQSSDGAPQTYELDTTALSVTLGSNSVRTISGGAKLSRTAGANPLVATVLKFVGVVEGLTLHATSGAVRLVDLGGGSDEITFRKCTFTCAAGITVPELVRLNSGGRYRFVDCTFNISSGEATDGVIIDHATDAVFAGCKFIGGRYGIRLNTEPARLQVQNCTFTDNDVGVYGTTGSDETTLIGCRFDSMNIAHVDITGGLYCAGSGDWGLGNSLSAAGLNVRGTTGLFRERLYLDTERIGGADNVPRYIGVNSSNQLFGRQRDGVTALDHLARYVFAGGDRVIFASAGDTGHRFQRVLDSGETRVSLLSDASLTDPSSHLHVGGLHLGDHAHAWGRVRAGMVPLGWGRLRKVSGTPRETFSVTWFDKSGSDDIQADVTETWDGSDSYHRWTVPLIPNATSSANVSVQASLHFDLAEAGIAGTGVIDYRNGGVHIHKSGTEMQMRPVLLDSTGAQIGFKDDGSDNFDNGTILQYEIHWVVWALPSSVVS